jgi:8-oxo-dGTP pyrophosphatase MutT (NUDIX family)
MGKTTSDLCYYKKMNQKEWEASIAWSKVAAGCVIRQNDGKYLLVQEMQPMVYGLWNIPAGHVDKGESIEEAAVREVKEETGYEVELGNKIGIYHEIIETPIRHAFTATIIGGELKVQADEILDAKWLSFNEITTMKHEGKLRAPWIYDAISKVEGGVA